MVIHGQSVPCPLIHFLKLILPPKTPQVKMATAFLHAESVPCGAFGSGPNLP